MAEKNIGVLSKFVGVSAHTIKYYEKIGLLSSNRDERSNYRRYDVGVCTDILECMKYRNMGFPLKELKILREEADAAVMDEMIQKRLMELDVEIASLLRMRDRTDQYYQETIEVEENLGQWFIEPCPYLYFMRQTDGLDYVLENSLQLEELNLADLLPECKPCARIARRFFTEDVCDFSWGQGIVSKLPRIELEEEEKLEKIKTKKAFVTYVKDTGHYITQGTILEKISKLYQEFQGEIPGDVYLFNIKIVHEKGQQYHYFKVYIPIPEKG